MTPAVVEEDRRWKRLDKADTVALRRLYSPGTSPQERREIRRDRKQLAAEMEALSHRLHHLEVVLERVLEEHDDEAAPAAV